MSVVEGPVVDRGYLLRVLQEREQFNLVRLPVLDLVRENEGLRRPRIAYLHIAYEEEPP